MQGLYGKDTGKRSDVGDAWRGVAAIGVASCPPDGVAWNPHLRTWQSLPSPESVPC
jgi:hypothetical protein